MAPRKMRMFLFQQQRSGFFFGISPWGFQEFHEDFTRKSQASHPGAAAQADFRGPCTTWSFSRLPPARTAVPPTWGCSVTETFGPVNPGWKHLKDEHRLHVVANEGDPTCRRFSTGTKWHWPSSRRNNRPSIVPKKQHQTASEHQT